MSGGIERLMNDDGEVEALRSLVSLPWITQQHFVGMLQARRTDAVMQLDQVVEITFANGNSSAFENSLDSGSFVSLPARCTKTTLLETW